MNNTVLEAIRGFLKEDEDALAVGAKKQQHTAKRIYDRLKATEDLGFKGSYESVARVVQQLRKKPSEVFIPLAWEPGEAVQADWGEAVIFIQGQRVKAHMFCTRLCYSAMLFVVVYPGECNEFFLDGHRLSFEFYQGAPHRMIYDNLRTAVQKGWGRYVTQKQPSLRLLEAHYAYVSEFCNPSSGNEKGLVEGLVGWARRNILTPIPRVDSWDEVNDLLRQRCMQYQEHWIEGHRSTVGVEYETERRFLLPLPVKPLDTFRTQTSLVHDDKFDPCR